MKNTLVIVTGIRKIDRRLRSLEPRVQKKVVRQAIRKGLKVEQAAMAAAAPFDTGLMRSSVKVRAAKARKRGEIKLLALISGKVPGLVKSYGPDKKRAFYPAIVEFGRGKKQNIFKRILSGRAKSFESHGAAKPNPFVKRAFNSTANIARDVAIAELLLGIEREASK